MRRYPTLRCRAALANLRYLPLRYPQTDLSCLARAGGTTARDIPIPRLCLLASPSTVTRGPVRRQWAYGMRGEKHTTRRRVVSAAAAAAKEVPNAPHPHYLTDSPSTEGL